MLLPAQDLAVVVWLQVLWFVLVATQSRRSASDVSSSFSIRPNAVKSAKCRAAPRRAELIASATHAPGMPTQTARRTLPVTANPLIGGLKSARNTLKLMYQVFSPMGPALSPVTLEALHPCCSQCWAGEIELHTVSIGNPQQEIVMCRLKQRPEALVDPQGPGNVRMPGQRVVTIPASLTGEGGKA